MKTKKDLIIESISLMDIDMLELLLEDDRTYSDASKSMFLQKLSDRFKVFKNSSDTMLEPKRGKCWYGECENCGKKGLSFIGNVSRKHIDLIIEEDETNILDIYHCRMFQIFYMRKKLGKSIPLEIEEDDMLDFAPTPEYLLTRKSCEDAINEILPMGEGCIGKEEYMLWIVKHKKLYQSLTGDMYDFPRFWHFKELYVSLEDLSVTAMYEIVAEKAMEEYGEDEKNDVKACLKWMVKYEKLAMTCFLIKGCPFNEQSHGNKGIAKLDDKFNLYVYTDDFKYLIEFMRFIKVYYWNLFEGYRTMSEQECVEHVEKYGDSSQVYFLSYHLKERGMI